MRTEFYGIGAYPAESCTLAFIWMFTINNNARYGNQEGPGELQLAASRDLVHWERPFRQPCVPRGKVGEWDCGFFGTQARALRVGDEVWLYYGGSNYTHGTPCLYRAEGTGRGTQYTGSLGLAIWDLDRFVSVDAPAEGGSLTTVPLAFADGRMEVNARVTGALTVTLCDAAGRPIPVSKRRTRSRAITSVTRLRGAARPMCRRCAANRSWCGSHCATLNSSRLRSGNNRASGVAKSAENSLKTGEKACPLPQAACIDVCRIPAQNGMRMEGLRS